MAKSLTSLLLGICVDRGLVRSMDDAAQDYVPSLKGMVGHDGQRVIVERSTQTVLVQTALDPSAQWVPELNVIMAAAMRMPAIA
jgi:hypothetical protein